MSSDHHHLGVEDRAIGSDTTALHRIDNQSSDLWVADNENRLCSGLFEQLPCDGRHVRTSQLLGIPDYSLRVSCIDVVDNLLTESCQRIWGRPEDTDGGAGRWLHCKQIEAGTDTTTCGDQDNGFEDQRHVQNASGWQAAGPVEGLRVGNGFAGPVAGFGDDNGVRAAVSGDGVDEACEGVPFTQRAIGDADGVEVGNVCLQMETQGMGG